MQNAYSECTLNDVCPQACGGGGHLYLKLDIILVKKNHVIRLVFQDQAMYVRTSFRGVKTGKMGGGGIFSHGVKFWRGRDGHIFKKHAKTCIYRVCFHAWKIRALCVF